MSPAGDREVAAELASRLPAITLAFVAAAACARDPRVPPVPKRWATDTVGVLSPVMLERLDARLEAYQRSTGHHVLLYVTQSSNRELHIDWMDRVFNAWGIGRANYDDGAVLFIFVRDDKRGIYRGYGLESTLSDKEATRICAEVIKPLIQRGQYDEGASAGVDAILDTIGYGR